MCGVTNVLRERLLYGWCYGTVSSVDGYRCSLSI